MLAAVRATLLLLVIAGSTACMVSPQDYAGRACDADHPCLDGRVCVANQCVEPTSTTSCSGVPVGESCSVGQGVCASTGTWVCEGGTARCNAPEVDSGAEELCDGLDNDCNGIVDDVSGCMFTLVGQSGPAALKDGSGDEARLAMPGYLNVGNDGNLLLADTGNHAIRHITLDGVVTTIAGAGRCGFRDGPVDQALFCEPYEVVQASDGALYVSDAGNNRIRRIHEGQVTTVAGNGVAGLVNGYAPDARLDYPMGLFLRSDGSLLIADSYNAVIRRYIPGTNPQLQTFAGAGWGTEEGSRSTVRFQGVADVEEDGNGALYVSDVYATRIRKIPVTGTSTTIAGVLYGYGYANGVGSEIRMSEPGQLFFDRPSGILYFADAWNYEVRAISPFGESYTVGGSHGFGYTSGTFEESRGQSVSGFVKVGQDFYFSDLNHVIRRNTAAGGALMTSDFVGGSLEPYARDGAGDQARLRQPRSLVRSADGTLYWSDYTGQLVRRLTPDGQVETLIGRTDAPEEGHVVGDFATARTSWPSGLAFDARGTLYLAEFGNSSIRKLDLESRQLLPFAGSGDGSWGYQDGAPADALFDGPRGLAYGRDGSGQEVLYVGDNYNWVLRKIVLPDGPVSTIAGVPGIQDRADGPPGEGMFFSLGAIAADLNGNVWIVDSGGIRHLAPDGMLTTPYASLPFHAETVTLDGDSLVVSGEAMVARMNALTPDPGSVEVIFEGRYGWQDGVSREAGGGDFESIVVTPEAYYIADFLTGQIRQLWR
jgi:sugar lactone lactonase YvrE